MEQQTANPLSATETEELHFLNAANLQFSTSGGSLRLAIVDGATFDRVKVVRAFPLSAPADYLSVRDKEDKEIGIIHKLSEIEKAGRVLVEKELARRYFVPVIARIVSTRMQFGFVHWDVETDRGRCSFTTRNLRDVVIRVSAGRYILADVDNNRYDIRDMGELDPRSQSLLVQQI